jgi:uncharacterized SAM-binding protein YcdF (DUF218 family)
MRKGILICAVLIIAGPRLWPQQGRHDEIISNIGLRLEDLFLRFGAPKTVHSARGDEDWQDDVVFFFFLLDFYIYRDRVWQIGLKSGYGIKIGDAKAAALAALADKAQDEGDYLLYPLTGGAWPLSLRVNFTAGRISGIFVYRTDL